MKNVKLFFFAFVAFALFFVSCENDDNIEPGKYEKGAFILNEGAFGAGNASVSFYSFQDDLVSEEIFFEENQRPLGDVLQDAHITDNNMYLVLNGSSKVEVVAAKDFVEKGVIEGLDGPRYITSFGDKVYISQWGENGAVKVVDKDLLQVSKTITAGTGPEGILTSNGKVWLANGGGFAVDSTVMVIDPNQDEVINTVVVGHNPKELVEDNLGNIWVICYGYIMYNDDFTVASQTPSKLVCISKDSYEIISELVISEVLHPGHLDISPDGRTLYYGGGFGFNGIFAVGIDANTVPANPLIEGYYYGFNIDPDSGEIYTLASPAFDTAGILQRYSQEGTLIKEYKVGIGPNKALFP